MKSLFRILVVCLIALTGFAQTSKSPSEFQKYPLGSKFTFHHKIISYVEYLAAENPSRVKLIPYGESNEGRPLLVAVIAKPEYLSKLESIRTNNLKSIGLAEGTSTEKVPAIAWLSYNVHGNEAVSSEAVMKVMYELLNTNNSKSKEILENTVVILDPCINPDGRDRYAQWYNRVSGQSPNLNPASIEHHEPWPGGRFNHYFFDLNRDWAWQVQKESQLRMKLYNSWMPHLHADFHEMGANSTYYFPPSARPYHENLSLYQREFQTKLGEFNKKNFDEKGWLFYTKEDYDLLYPSYGDTYPSYNGAIGMTFEQGGSGQAGLAFMRYDEDTLSLYDRIEHHFSTSMGTLNAISANADKTVEEFQKFFKETSIKGAGKYKSYVLKNENSGKIKALTKMLDGMQIEYSFADKASQSSGYNYKTKKEQSFKIEENDLIVSTMQAKGTFAKILFEPETALEDSNTYDITAWALPYAFDLTTYALNQNIIGTKTQKTNEKTVEYSSKIYAYLVEWKSFEDAKFLSALYNRNIKVRVAEKQFVVNNKTFEPGTLIITKKGNENIQNFNEIIKSSAAEFGVNIESTTSGMVSKGSDLGSGNVSFLKAPKAAFLIGEGVSPTAAGEVWHFMEKQLNYPVTVIDVNYFSKINLWDFTTLIIPDGRYSNSIKDPKELQRWVSDGGRLIIMENANSFFADKDGFDLKTKPEPKETDTDQKYGDRERNRIKNSIPGAIFQAKIDNTHPLGYGFGEHYYSLLKDVYDFEKLKKGWNVAVLPENSKLSGFAGSNTKEKTKNLSILSVQNSGSGQIIYMLDGPLFRGFWYTGKLLFSNALFMNN